MATQYTGGTVAGQILTAATMNSIGAAWDTWTPTITATVGSFTTTTVTFARYSQVQKLITCQFKVNIVVVGTASGLLVMTLPTPMVGSFSAGGSLGTYRETTAGGGGFIIALDANTAAPITPAETGGIGVGKSFVGTFTYEAA